MKKIAFRSPLSALLAAVLILCSCSKTKQFDVTLNLDNAENQTFYLCKTVDGNDVVIDSAVIAGKQAVLTVPCDDPQTLYIIKSDKNDQCGVFTFFTENQNTAISGIGDDMPHWSVKGCPTMDTLMAHHERCMELYENRILSIYVEMMSADTTEVLELDAQLQPIIKEYFNYQADFVRRHSDSYIGHYMLDIMKNDLDPQLVQELYSGFTTESPFSQNVKQFLNK